MKVKKYVASSMPEAMKQIRTELGNDAVILNSKIVYTGGFLGFFRKKNIEVIAAMDQVGKMEPKVKEKPKLAPISQPVKNPPIAKPQVISTPENRLDRPSGDLLNELAELKAMVKNMSATGQGGMSYPGPLDDLSRELKKQEIEPYIREELMSVLLEKWYTVGAVSSEEEVKAWCKDLMKERISGLPYGDISFAKKYVNVVGPTGVGKTTTLAKIAADSILKFHKKVALITTDTYRIAAIEQLKIYAKILAIPLEVCYNLDDFRKACESFKDYDVVLIDTAGRNFRNEQYVVELKQILDYDNDMETFLVLSLTSKQNDMEEIYKQFSSIAINQFIFTKMDETSSYGAMYNMIDKYRIGAAYLTNGQNVPDDKVAASADVITNLILGDETK
ncbi:flagellar biosynthesis protein FlhF [Robertmurraya kyonggiensis]|uniref:Flagellar biosynthesis protein FlhF n=1 Tax=Robertmurraya kyonggiensis TaxID=1037680 RepID=A0A4U1D9K0_9BACI|nr:flagellar biosynthesis protein FlhF [Robertmurraya kyonggiensis]TKC18673.1 flagellar biosynthesis protein FlhF [Robertmurraya kyonggiensis]